MWHNFSRQIFLYKRKCLIMSYMCQKSYQIQSTKLKSEKRGENIFILSLWYQDSKPQFFKKKCGKSTSICTFASMFFTFNCIKEISTEPRKTQSLFNLFFWRPALRLISILGLFMIVQMNSLVFHFYCALPADKCTLIAFMFVPQSVVHETCNYW